MLSKRWIVNYILLALIAALLYAALGTELEPVNETPAGISELTARDIDTLEIETGGKLIRLVSDGDTWVIEAPINWPAQQTNVQRLLAIVDLEADALGDAVGIDLAPLGLHQPVATLRFNGSELQFGTNNNIGARRYAMIDSKIYLLPDAHLPFISQGLAGVVDRHLLPQGYNLQSLQLPDFDVRRDGDTGWHSTQVPGITSARLSQLVTNWQSLEALRITGFTPTTDPLQVIHLELADDQILELLLVSNDPEVVIANPLIGLQYHFRSDDYHLLFSAADDETSA